MSRHCFPPDKVVPPAAKRDISPSDLTESVAAKANNDELFKGAAEHFAEDLNASKEQFVGTWPDKIMFHVVRVVSFAGSWIQKLLGRLPVLAPHSSEQVSKCGQAWVSGAE